METVLMVSTRSLSQESIKKILVGSFCLPLVFQAMPVRAFSLVGDKPDKPKNTKLQMPINEPLSLGAGPQINDKSKGGAAGGADLSPINLDNANQQQTASPASPASPDDAKEASESGVLNGSVRDTQYAATPLGGGDNHGGSDSHGGGDNESVMAPKSIKDEKPPSDPNVANIGKMQLEQTDDEAAKKVETLLDMERAELSDLWDATLVRSKDIQFVVAKLSPQKNTDTGDKGVIKNLGNSIFNASGAFASLSRGGALPGGTGADLVKSVLVQGNSETAKKANITENEAIQLYNMIRNTAKTLVDNYYSYKKFRNSLSRAGIDLMDLQAMVKEAVAKSDAGKQSEMSYILRKQNREIDALKDELSQTRSRLVELAGEKAIDKLDTQIEVENGKLEIETHIGDAKPPTAESAQ
jgi:hypothetical protein